MQIISKVSPAPPEIPPHRLGQPYATLKSQLTEYDAWLKATVLPNARTDFRLPPEEYALALEGYGIDIPPAQARRDGPQRIRRSPGRDESRRRRDRASSATSLRPTIAT